MPFLGDATTIFLDVGNTLISVDCEWIARELCARGVDCTAEHLRRGEAAARPAYSRRLFVTGVPAGTDLFHAYLTAMLAELPVLGSSSLHEIQTLATTLKPVLRPDGRASVLWRSVMPRVPEALARLRDRGFQLVVVSNSDGTAEQSLEAAGLRRYLHAVIDSAFVGFEKPDRRIFLAALEQCGADPARTVHIGDLYHADVTGARSAGVGAILLDPYGDWGDVDCPRARDLWEVAGS